MSDCTAGTGEGKGAGRLPNNRRGSRFIPSPVRTIPVPKPHAALLSLFLLAACAPVYETAYEFVPPATAEGQRCAEQCLAERAGCAQSCERNERLCVADAESRALRDYRMEQDVWDRRRGAGSRTYFDYANRYRAVCYAGGCRSACEATHRACYESCGGRVVATQVCTANCGR